jgi:hypothetical protein
VISVETRRLAGSPQTVGLIIDDEPLNHKPQGSPDRLRTAASVVDTEGELILIGVAVGRLSLDRHMLASPTRELNESASI